MHIKIRRHWKSTLRVKNLSDSTRGDCGIVTSTSFDLLRLGPVYLRIKNYALSKVSHRHLRLLANIGTHIWRQVAGPSMTSVFSKSSGFFSYTRLFPKTQLSRTFSKTPERFNFDTVDKCMRLYEFYDLL